MPVYQHILTAPPEPVALGSLVDWCGCHARAAAGFARPFERAVAGGFAADRPAYAFASGYAEAMHALLPGDRGATTSMAATEQGSAHPRTIQTRLVPRGDGFVLDGDKSFVTMAEVADDLLVVCSVGHDHDRNQLAAVRIPRRRAGVTLEPLAAPPFVPEISHARVRFAGVAVAADERLPGDGYDGYLKPFRTVEDIHVFAGLLGWFVQVARRSQWSETTVEDLIAVLGALDGLAASDRSAPLTHLALAGVLDWADRLLQELRLQLEHTDSDTRDRWRRDVALLEVAGTAREARRVAAWKRLREPTAPP